MLNFHYLNNKYKSTIWSLIDISIATIIIINITIMFNCYINTVLNFINFLVTFIILISITTLFLNVTVHWFKCVTIILILYIGININELSSIYYN